MKTEQAIDYIKCAKELNVLSALLMQQVTDENKRFKNRISAQAGDSLYHLWRIIENYCDDEKLKLAIEKYKEEEHEV